MLKHCRNDGERGRRAAIRPRASTLHVVISSAEKSPRPRFRNTFTTACLSLSLGDASATRAHARLCSDIYGALLGMTWGRGGQRLCDCTLERACHFERSREISSVPFQIHLFRNMASPSHGEVATRVSAWSERSKIIIFIPYCHPER